MAKETALAFFRKVHEDRRLQQGLVTLSRKDIKTLLQFAAESGYFFSRRDYQAALEANGELPEAARAMLANGYFVIPGLNLSSKDDAQRK